MYVSTWNGSASMKLKSPAIGDERLRRADQRLDPAAFLALHLARGADLDVEVLQRDRQAGHALKDVRHGDVQLVVVRAAAERLDRGVERHVDHRRLLAWMRKVRLLPFAPL
jgi:hypothetical protein